MNDIAGRTVIVTGAGAGIGQALAVGLAAKRVRVVAVGRSLDGLNETRRLSHGSDMLECHTLDVRDALALESLFGQVVQSRGCFDLLVNNAAVYPKALLVDTGPADWSRDVDTNLNGVVYACRAAVKAIPPGHRAVVLNVGSFAHRGPSSGSTLYCTTKAAVSAFSRAFAAELASQGSGIVVNEWVPGQYRTRMSDFVGDEPSLALDRLLAVWDMSTRGVGGRTFEEGVEHLPPRSRLSRVKAIFLGRRV